MNEEKAETNIENKKNNKKSVLLILISLVILVIVISSIITGYFLGLKPYLEAKKEYDSVVLVITEKNNELDKSIKDLQDLINSGEIPLDSTLIDIANERIKEAQQLKFIIGNMPTKVENIKKRTEEMKKPIDYTEIINKLKLDKTNLENSIKSYKQFDNPTEEFLINRLSSIDEIFDIEAVTEEHDPNGNLNKDGGYTACIYFKDKNLNMSSYSFVGSNSSIDIGTIGGGCIEIYRTSEQSSKRAEYLSRYDGSILASGTHKAINTTLIRTSNDLTATQQKGLEEKIINAFAEIK